MLSPRLIRSSIIVGCSELPPSEGGIFTRRCIISGYFRANSSHFDEPLMNWSGLVQLPQCPFRRDALLLKVFHYEGKLCFDAGLNGSLEPRSN